MLKYLFLAQLVLSCGKASMNSLEAPETVVESKHFQISNAPKASEEVTALKLTEEAASSYLNIEGQLTLPNIPDDFDKQLGCLDIKLDDQTFVDYASSLVVSTTGIFGKTFPSVNIFLFITNGQERFYLDPDAPVILASFSPGSSHSYTANLCFEIEYSEVPLQIYEGDINVQYKVQSENLQTADCAISSDPSTCISQDPITISIDPNSEDAEADNGEPDAGETENYTDEEQSQTEEDSGRDDTEEEPQGDTDSGTGGTDSEDGGEANQDEQSGHDEEGSEPSGDSSDAGQQDSPDDTGSTGDGSNEDNAEGENGNESEYTEAAPDGTQEANSVLSPAQQCASVGNKQGNQSKTITNSGSHFLEQGRFKIAGNKTTVMLYSDTGSQLEAACVFLAGNQSNAQVIVEGSIDKLIIIGRGNQVTTTVLVNEGGRIGEFILDFEGNNPSFFTSGGGEFNCPDEPEFGFVGCE